MLGVKRFAIVTAIVDLAPGFIGVLLKQLAWNLPEEYGELEHGSLRVGSSGCARKRKTVCCKLGLVQNGGSKYPRLFTLKL